MATLMDTVMQSWQTVCNENNSERDLVTTQQWETWLKYRQEMTQLLLTAVESGNPQHPNFQTVQNAIDRAKHVPKNELPSAGR